MASYHTPQQQMLQNGFHSMRMRVNLCIEQNGGHFQQLLITKLFHILLNQHRFFPNVSSEWSDFTEQGIPSSFQIAVFQMRKIVRLKGSSNPVSSVSLGKLFVKGWKEQDNSDPIHRTGEAKYDIASQQVGDIFQAPLPNNEYAH